MCDCVIKRKISSFFVGIFYMEWVLLHILTDQCKSSVIIQLHFTVYNAERFQKRVHLINNLDTMNQEGFWSFIIGPSRPSKMSLTSR